jgi:tetraacyldisaccharide 4'-kinase
LISLDANPVSTPPESLRGQYVFAMCGLGNPVAFHATLRTLGATVVGTHDLPDHFAYDEMWVKWEWPKVLQRARELGASKIIVTQKDAVKLRGRITGTEVPVIELRVQMELSEGREALLEVLKRVVA